MCTISCALSRCIGKLILMAISDNCLIGDRVTYLRFPHFYSSASNNKQPYFNLLSRYVTPVRNQSFMLNLLQLHLHSTFCATVSKCLSPIKVGQPRELLHTEHVKLFVNPWPEFSGFSRLWWGESALIVISLNIFLNNITTATRAK